MEPKQERPVICIRCNQPMPRVRVETWAPSNILLKQLQKIADQFIIGRYARKCFKKCFRH